MKRIAIAVLLITGTASAADFTYRPAGELVAGSGKGRVDTKVYAPGMRFPIEAAPAFANSQVWGAGGSMGPGGGQCATSNYSYPWHDNYCESRSWDMPLCPSGTGHQGQDIRPGTCAKDVHWAVAAADGTITNVGSYSVYLTAADGTRYDYLHMSGVAVKVGDKVKRGQHMGKVSNVFGGTPTTTHLHFNLQQNVSGVGRVYVPPYMSLVTSYQDLIGPPPDTNDPPTGTLEAASCDEIRGTAKDPDAVDKPIAVRIYFDGKIGDPMAKVINVTASPMFASKVPLAMQDNKPHEVRALAMDSAGGMNTELAGGPKTITCAATIPAGVKRHVTSPTSYSSWNFDPLWHQLTIDDSKLATIEAGNDLPASPKLVKADDMSPEVWLLDSGFRRHVPNPDVLVAWEFDGATIETMPAAEIAALPKGPDVRSAPFLVKGAGPEVFLIDDAFGNVTTPDAGVEDDSGVTPAADAEGEDLKGSCGCRVPGGSAPRGAGALIALAIWGALRSRRRTAPRSSASCRGFRF
jgi:murein DD-endopeptidase MepM/ murein hydrolase activator NlpD